MKDDSGNSILKEFFKLSYKDYENFCNYIRNNKHSAVSMDYVEKVAEKRERKENAI